MKAFKQDLLAAMNQDVYYQLKSWLQDNLEDEDDYEEALYYISSHLHDELVWRKS